MKLDKFKNGVIGNKIINKKEEKMDEIIKIELKNFEDIKHIDENGVEFGYARELMEVLEYKEWRNFLKVINKAKNSVESTEITINHHFVDVNKIVKAGISSKPLTDIILSRYACYLIVQNGDPRKKEIAYGQQYFAVQTRKQELSETEFENLSEDDRRLFLRNQTKKHNKILSKTAHEYANVNNYGKFHNAGYKGLYNGETASKIKSRKNLKKNEDILDFMGSTELAANYFRITQTDERLKQGDIKTENLACKTHNDIGKKVRETMIEISGIAPEELPTPEKSVKLIEKEKKEKLKLENKVKKLK